MAIGAIGNAHILTRRGFEKLEFSQTGPQQKIRLYYIKDLTIEKIESVRTAILEELHVKGRAFEGEIGTFEQKILDTPYLIKEGRSLRLISYEEMTLYFKQALESTNGREAKASMYCKIGNTYQSLGRYQDALGYHQLCLNFAIEQQDKEAEGGRVLQHCERLPLSGELPTSSSLLPEVFRDC